MAAICMLLSLQERLLTEPALRIFCNGCAIVKPVTVVWYKLELQISLRLGEACSSVFPSFTVIFSESSSLFSKGLSFCRSVHASLDSDPFGTLIYWPLPVVFNTRFPNPLPLQHPSCRSSFPCRRLLNHAPRSWMGRLKFYHI